MAQTQNAEFSSPGVATEGGSFAAPFPVMGRPAAGSGELTVRLRKTEPEALTVDVALLQGTAIIASRTVSPTTSFADYSLGLTADDINELTTGTCNLSDLTVRVTCNSSSSSSSSSSGSSNGGTVQTGCCPGGLPSTLTATFSDNFIEACSAINGQEITLQWNGSDAWEGSGTICDEWTTIRLWCKDGLPEEGITRMRITVAGEDDCWQSSPPELQCSFETCSCDPFELTFSLPLAGATCECCSGIVEDFQMKVVITQ